MGKSIREKRRKHLGKKARRHLNKLLNHFGHRCHWCKRYIVALGSIPMRDRIQVDHDTVRYRTFNTGLRGQIRVDYMASVDHLIALAEGGTNEIDNLVPSCRKCNEDRGVELESRLREKKYKSLLDGR